MAPHLQALRIHPTAEVAPRKGPWGEQWPVWQVLVKEDHSSQKGSVPANCWAWTSCTHRWQEIYPASKHIF